MLPPFDGKLTWGCLWPERKSKLDLLKKEKDEQWPKWGRGGGRGGPWNSWSHGGLLVVMVDSECNVMWFFYSQSAEDSLRPSAVQGKLRLLLHKTQMYGRDLNINGWISFFVVDMAYVVDSTNGHMKKCVFVFRERPTFRIRIGSRLSLSVTFSSQKRWVVWRNTVGKIVVGEDARRIKGFFLESRASLTTVGSLETLEDMLDYPVEQLK